EGIMLTPLQLAGLVATIADDGRWVQPSLVRYTIDQKGKTSYPHHKNSEQAVSSATARQVQDLLKLTVS
ncbi:MAG TPA: peptidoglycan glycosyltransferase, partial [Syntrophomonas sp.]|nr:peptidoglycan glycosyltransferase [Syntrophomonas sp.]